MSVTPVPTTPGEASPSPASGAIPEEAGAAPFAQMLAKAAAAGTGDSVAKARAVDPTMVKPQEGSGQNMAPLEALLTARLPEAVPQSGLAKVPGRDRPPEKEKAVSTGQSGNGLPPLAVPLILSVPLQKVDVAAQAGASASPQVVGSGQPPVRPQPLEGALLPTAPEAAGATRKSELEAVRAGLPQVPAPASRGGEPLIPAPVSAALRQALEPAAQSTLTPPNEVHGAAAPLRADAAPGTLPTLGAAQLPWLPPAAAAQAPAQQGAVSTPLASPHWGQDLGQQLLIGIQGNAQTLTLHVNPPQLGLLQVHLQVNDGQASALFVSPHLAVRQALEGAMPQLRDIFADAGMALLQTQVSADGGGARRDRPRYGGRTTAALPVGEEENAPSFTYWRAGFVNTYV